MGTYGDIRTRFEMAMNLDSMLNEKVKYNGKLSAEVRDLILKNKIRGNKNQNLGELRFALSGDSTATEDILSDVILKGIDPSDYTLSFESPDRAKKGDAKSGTYNTHKLTVLNPFKIGKYDAEPGDFCYIIDNLVAKSNITNKMLAPDGLELSGKSYTNIPTLRSEVERKLEKFVLVNAITKTHKIVMLSLFDDVVLNTKKADGGAKIGHSDVLNIVDNLITELSGPDVLKIAKDFGEVLGGVYMFQLTGGGKLGIGFPANSNEPLVDFSIDGQGISMKSGTGAAPSLRTVGELIAKDPKKWENLMSSKEEVLMLNVVKTFNDNTAADGMFKVAELVNAPGWSLLKQLLDNSSLKSSDINIKKLNKWVVDGFTNNPEEYYMKFDTYFKGLGKYPDDWNNKESQIENASSRKYPFGLIFSPLAYSLKDFMNEQELLINALGSVIQKFDVLQLYIDLKINKTKKYQKYTLKSFSTGKFKFHATPSVNLPTRNKFGFKMIK